MEFDTKDQVLYILKKWLHVARSQSIAKADSWLFSVELSLVEMSLDGLCSLIFEVSRFTKSVSNSCKVKEVIEVIEAIEIICLWGHLGHWCH